MTGLEPVAERCAGANPARGTILLALSLSPKDIGQIVEKSSMCDYQFLICGHSSIGRAFGFQPKGYEIVARCPLQFIRCSLYVEHSPFLEVVKGLWVQLPNSEPIICGISSSVEQHLY